MGLALAIELLSFRHANAEAFAFFYADSNAPITTYFVMLAVGLLAAHQIKPWKLPDPRPLFNGWLVLHVVAYAGLYFNWQRLWSWTLADPQGGIILATGGGLLLVSWALSLLPLKAWRRFVEDNFSVLAVLLGYSYISVRLLPFANSIWSGLIVENTFTWIEWVLGFWFQGVIAEPDTLVIGVEHFQVIVGAPCAGFEGIGLITLFLSLYLFLRREELRFPHALILVPLGMFLSWAFNVLRVAVLVWIGATISPSIALGVFHARGGWLAFLMLAVGFVLVLELTGLFRKVRVEGTEFPSLPFLLPQFAQLGLTLLFAAFVEGLDLAYPMRTLLVFGVLLLCCLRLPEDLNLWLSPTLAACGIGFFVYLLWVPMAGGDPVEDPRYQLTVFWGSLWLLSRLVGSVGVVPLVEELCFRGYLLRRLQSPNFMEIPMGTLTLSSVVISSLVFGLLHQAWFAGTLAGIAYAYATTLRRSLGDAVVAHAVTNLCIAVHVVAGNRWDLWI